mmetsp:Transcript_33926/g.101220  ORF Transcript_33926/g.101220 Transcript_33926/m.101220 type:complete len:224 (+) Transcript_33926:3807-4478(+)
MTGLSLSARPSLTTERSSRSIIPSKNSSSSLQTLMGQLVFLVGRRKSASKTRLMASKLQSQHPVRGKSGTAGGGAIGSNSSGLSSMIKEEFPATSDDMAGPVGGCSCAGLVISSGATPFMSATASPALSSSTTDRRPRPARTERAVRRGGGDSFDTTWCAVFLARAPSEVASGSGVAENEEEPKFMHTPLCTHRCRFVPGPPKRGLSRQFSHLPQSSTRHASH